MTASPALRVHYGPPSLPPHLTSYLFIDESQCILQYLACYSGDLSSTRRFVGDREFVNRYEVTSCWKRASLRGLGELWAPQGAPWAPQGALGAAPTKKRIKFEGYFRASMARSSRGVHQNEHPKILILLRLLSFYFNLISSYFIFFILFHHKSTENGNGGETAAPDPTSTRAHVLHTTGVKQTHLN